MDVHKTHYVMKGRHHVKLSLGDIELVFFNDENNIEQVVLVMADGRAFHRINLGDLCLLLRSVRDEIAARHWGKRESLEDALAAVDRQSTSARD